MAVSFSGVLKDLRAKEYAPVYFLQGEESFFIDAIIDFIENSVLSDSEKSFNQVVLYGKDVNMATILTHARRFPMMAERQVVIVKEAQEIQDINKESGSKLLLDYLNNPVPSTLLAFGHKHKTLDKRRALGKNIDKMAVSLTSKKVYDNQLPAFVTEYVVEKHAKIEEGGTQILCEYVGNDLSRLANEIDKLLITQKQGEVITADRVMAQVGVSKEYNIFELQKAIIKKDMLTATKIVRYFESNTRRNPLIPVVAFLYSFFSKLLLAAQAPDKSEKGLANALRVSPYAIRDYSQALRNYTLPKIVNNLSLIKETDLKLKGVDSGSTSDGQLFKELVYRIMN